MTWDLVKDLHEKIWLEFFNKIRKHWALSSSIMLGHPALELPLHAVMVSTWWLSDWLSRWIVLSSFIYPLVGSQPQSINLWKSFFMLFWHESCGWWVKPSHLWRCFWTINLKSYLFFHEHVNCVKSWPKHLYKPLTSVSITLLWMIRKVY